MCKFHDKSTKNNTEPRIFDGGKPKTEVVQNWSTKTCNDACWRVSYFDSELGNVRNDYGCMDSTFCDDSYQSEQCYRPDASGHGHVCVQEPVLT